ncbi:hypothetical protein LTR56_016243 [Elasticomyces elasticus]|nr:hypothetical protein LTR56_016243 [Elasticomyces elasticus]KAK3636085.1 hypothetical protein LTR22_018932 [Elasticomyces elasticus]KAK4912302.1 hypothetical protein LTR49_019210 [Elasticomyces elasticus]KAK5751375.1 hypothetical protein LTS12_018533 [Elasticomyces elasticus]
MGSKPSIEVLELKGVISRGLGRALRNYDPLRDTTVLDSLMIFAMVMTWLDGFEATLLHTKEIVHREYQTSLAGGVRTYEDAQIADIFTFVLSHEVEDPEVQRCRRLAIEGLNMTLDLDQQPSNQSDYDDTSITDGDRATIVCDDKEVTHRPIRIGQRVARYTELNTLFVNWLISYAQKHNYHNLSSIVSRRRRGRGRRINIRALVDKNYELLARHLVRHLTVPSSVANYIQEIIQLRSFVSDWYVNMHKVTDPLETCEIAARTEKHRAFIDMLEHLRQILRDNQAHESVQA